MMHHSFQGPSVTPWPGTGLRARQTPTSHEGQEYLDTTEEEREWNPHLVGGL